MAVKTSGQLYLESLPYITVASSCFSFLLKCLKLQPRPHWAALAKAETVQQMSFSGDEYQHQQPSAGIKVVQLLYSSVPIQKEGKIGMGLGCTPGETHWH